jgi:hypothetical protein
LEKRVGFPVTVPPEPLITGALGAALIASEETKKISREELIEKQLKRRWEAVTFFDEKPT